MPVKFANSSAGTYDVASIKRFQGRFSGLAESRFIDRQWSVALASSDLYDESDELAADAEFLLHFEAGIRDLNAGRRISADDLERELGL